MENGLTISEAVAMLENICANIVQNEPYLTEIDSETGDGDHGVGMKTGFLAVSAMLTGTNFTSVRTLFRDVGMKLIDSMGGASGVLFGTLFISGLQQIKNDKYLMLGDFANMLVDSMEAIMNRGGARVGDKTMVDALYPAVQAFRNAANQGGNFKYASFKAYIAAKEGMESTRPLMAKKGRASTFNELSVGHLDAGAISVMLIFEAIWKTMKEGNMS